MFLMNVKNRNMHIIVYSLSPIERYHGSWKLELVVWLGLLIEGREKKSLCCCNNV